ncbi:hypothetical protein IMG5_002790 [Ichthyophthirius multifiliis]|uniref:Uncharacterized protein n=1 Tax=Ichthyophthirius multifiliis TaxID=5932 RepID=G0QJ65_ICHMU|nr:hypothetical protein IMG5_002790 [Ichthyophthirius multifiliis]EGR34746.1 hypothetical protein IMG5_002790 [Ichthyophthirius multifiliis]|eukprot:XP_004040050.1 hypothetical protein IMG5_002790 [Ichthyophthirius multifiliis]
MSNGSQQSLQQLARNSLPDIEFQYFFDSTSSKYFKPRLEMYRQVEQTGYQIDEILHVAGAIIDVKGARDYGLFVGHNKIIDDQFYGFLESEKPCFEVKDISGVVDVMLSQDPNLVKLYFKKDNGQIIQ